MKNIKFNWLFRGSFCAGLLFLSAGCDSFVEVALPSSQLTSSTVFQEKATADAAMTSVYSKIRDTGLVTGLLSGMSGCLGLYGDELNYYGSSSANSVFYYNNTVLPSNTTVSNLLSASYNQIYSANAVYEGVAASTKLAQADKDQLMGEALFVRGLIHFYLLNVFGDVPYITTTDYMINQSVQRMPATAVYEKIITDLETASTLLPITEVSGLRGRPNKFAAKALLARVYLYHGDFAEASNAASTVINESATYYTEPNMNTTFLKGSHSTIWQLIPKISGGNTDEGGIFIFNSGPPPNVALRSELVSAFEAGDLRRTNWIRGVTTGGNTWYHSYKYKQRTTTGSTTQECSVVLRLSEQYLIRSEARVQQGDLIGAKEDLNFVRAYAGLIATAAVTQQEILDAVFRERRVELFTEYGHRFFDLKRTNKLDAVLSPIKPGWNSYENLLPLPESELLLNPNLAPQNPFY